MSKGFGSAETGEDAFLTGKVPGCILVFKAPGKPEGLGIVGV